MMRQWKKREAILEINEGRRRARSYLSLLRIGRRRRSYLKLIKEWKESPEFDKGVKRERGCT
jgi:hypothetical protein